MKHLLAVLLCVLVVGAQEKSSPEEQDLETALRESGSSAVEYVRALEAHLKKYPQSKQRNDIERVLLEASVELKDKRRIASYGAMSVERGLRDPRLLDHVARALLDDAAGAEKALSIAELLGKAMDADAASIPARQREDFEKKRAGAQLLQARALAKLGRLDDAVARARAAHDAYPNDETARDLGRLLEQAGKLDEAAGFYAEAFALGTTQRQGDRVLLGAVYRKAHGSEQGMGEVLLAAWDRGQKRIEDRKVRLRAIDPNATATEPAEFVLTGLKGEKLALASLKGKVAVLDFWATWCGPCRAQYPLYQRVQERFNTNPDVVFLAVNTDEDKAIVEPFLKAQGWKKNVWFEDGLQSLLRVSSIPTTVVLDREGRVASRMNGYIPERFVDMLTVRVQEALEAK